MKIIKIFLCLYVSLGVMTLTYGARLNKGGPFIEMGIGTAKIQNCGIDDKGSDRECHGENRQISVGYLSKMHTESDTGYRGQFGFRLSRNQYSQLSFNDTSIQGILTNISLTQKLHYFSSELWTPLSVTIEIGYGQINLKEDNKFMTKERSIGTMTGGFTFAYDLSEKLNLGIGLFTTMGSQLKTNNNEANGDIGDIFLKTRFMF